MITLRTKTRVALAALVAAYPSGTVTRAEVEAAVESGLIEKYPQWLTTATELRVARGVYRLPVELLDGSAPEAVKPKRKTAKKPAPAKPAPVKRAAAKPEAVEQIMSVSADQSFVPSKDANYIPWGNSKLLSSVLNSGKFMPVFITGLSGNGKTFMIEQEVAKAKRELFRVNINMATDEDDLIGGFRLVNGDTVWSDGPVVEAMKRGAVLLLDELDLGTEKILCLQSVLEGKGIFIKKTNQWVTPADGFTVIATGNTKGQGDDTNKFIGANVMNEAFLERFPVWLEQSYAPESTEKRIITRLSESLDLKLTGDEIDTLVKFAQQTRRAYADGVIDDLIATRRLCLIVELIPVFGSIKSAIDVATNRFCSDSKTAIVKFYSALVAEKNAPADPAGVSTSTATDETVAADDNDHPF